MNKKLKSKTRKNGKVASITPASPTESKPEENAVVALPPGVSVTHLEFPPPDYLLQKARGESNRRLLEDYRDTIQVLRDEKGFSFREIGDWLTENGIEADYNSVYRVYTSRMSDEEKGQMASEDAYNGRD